MRGGIEDMTDFASRRAGHLLLLGLTGVAWRTWRLWQADKALAARLQAYPPATPALPRTPRVSALVAAWDEHRHIDEHIRSFLALSYPDKELIICAGGRDDTLARARRFAGRDVVVIEQQPGEGKQRALARCLRRASGEIVYLTDADCRYSDEALHRLLAPLLAEGEEAATGSSRPLDVQLDKVLPAYLWASTAVADARRPRYSGGLLGRNAAITRRGLERSGGLDFVARTGTDYQLARRLIGSGIAIRFVPDSIVQSAYPEGLAVYRQKQSRWLRNLLLHGRRYGATGDVWVTGKTVATGALMVLAPLGGLVLGPLVFVAWLCLISYAVAAKARYVLFAARLHRWPVPARLFAALAPLTLIDFVIWTTPIFDILIAGRRERW